MVSSAHVTQLLEAWHQGDPAAQSRLVEAVYGELKQLARMYLAREPTMQSVPPTALVHEAYLRLVDQRVAWQNRHHFFGVAAQAMRRVLVDHARAAKAAKRGGGDPGAHLEPVAATGGVQPVDLLALDEALTRLESLEPRWAHVVQLRYFAGLSVAETAEALGVSSATVKLDWSLARGWLYRELRGGTEGRDSSSL